MSDLVKDISKVWDRLFDQKGFLNGEISFTLKEFEGKRGDSEIENLFRTVENITDTKDTQINRLSELVTEKLLDANQQLSEALELCSQFSELENKYLENTLLEDARNKRKDQWEKVMDEITTEYTNINAEFEEKEKHVIKYYKDLEAKLKAQ